MKLFKRLMAVMFALTLTLGMGTRVYAEDETNAPTTHTITNGSTTHSYEIYQIFTGKYDSATRQLQGLKYGKNAVGTTGSAVSAADLKELSKYNDAGDTQALDQKDIAFISQFVNLKSNPHKTIAKGANVSVEEGYYLIKDVDGSLANTNEQYTLYLISVLNEDITITPKAGTTSSEKKVDDINDSTGTAENLQDSADYDIGDYVPFHLKATIAENVGAYKRYHLTFTDTLEAGKFDEITTPVIKVDGTEISKIASDAGFTATAEYTANPSVNGFEVTVTFVPTSTETGALLPSEKLSRKDVTIDFTAKLGEGANIGQPGNVNTLQVKYSNNPNSTDDSDEGITPEDTVIVFTYKLLVNKKDEGGNALNGATFALYKKYTDDQLSKTGKTAVDEIKYDDNKKTYDLKGAKYVQVGSDIVGTDLSTFEFKGVDDGDYLLVEVKAPTGYNCLEPKTFKITGTHTPTSDIDKTSKKDGEGKYILTSVSGSDEIELSQHTATDDVIDGLSTDVVNQSGSTLPSTGGIGTTIFYVLGGLLVAGAGIVLVARKKASE